MRQIVHDALPGTLMEVVERTGLCKTTVRKYIWQMREERLVYISKWIRSKAQGSFQPYFRLGKGKDAPCKLKAYDADQRWERFKDRHLKDGSLEDMRLRNN